MIFLLVLIAWVAVADQLSQLIVIAVALVLRVTYVSGRLPTIPKAMFVWWTVFVILAYVFFPALAGHTLFKILASAILTGLFIMDMLSRAGHSPLSHRVIIAREVSLFLGRGGVLIRKQIRDMSFWSQQSVRAVARIHADASPLTRAWHVQRAKLGSVLRLSIGLLQQTRLLNERFFAVVTARGGFPAVGASWSQPVPGARLWFSGALGDLALITLFAIAMWRADPALVPREILDLPRALTLL